MTPAFIVTGVDPQAQAAATLDLQFDLPGAVVVHSEIDLVGNRLRRTIADIGGVLEREDIDVAHACATCALREDIVPTVRRLAQIGRWEAIIVRLPVSADAMQLCRVLAVEPLDEVAIAGVFCALDGGSLVEDLTGSASLAEVDRQAHPGDERGLGETLAGLIEYADVVTAHTEDVSAARGVGVDLVRALARPDAVVAPQWPGFEPATLLTGLRQHDAAEAWVDDVRRGPLPQVPTGIWRIELSADRPLHPQRLNEYVETLGSHPHRARGCFWLASRPGEVCGWDGAGGHVSIGAVGRWSPGEVPVTRIMITGLCDEGGAPARVAPERLRSAFEACLLTDAEMRERGPYWDVASDGLEPWLGSIHHAA